MDKVKFLNKTIERLQTQEWEVRKSLDEALAALRRAEHSVSVHQENLELVQFHAKILREQVAQLESEPVQPARGEA